jgi:hypothetical protein
VDSGFFRIAYGECSIDSDFPFWGIGGTTYSLVSLRPWQVKEIITKKIPIPQSYSGETRLQENESGA